MARRLRRRRSTDFNPDAEGVAVAPERHNAARDVLDALAAGRLRTALKFVDATGVIDRWTSQDVASEASRWTALLRARGLAAGDRILVLLGETPARPTVLLGVLAGGFVAVPCADALGADEVESVLEHSGACLAIVDRAHAPRASGLRRPLDVVVVEEAVEELRALPIDEPTHDTASTSAAFMLFSVGVSRAPSVIAHGDCYELALRSRSDDMLDIRAGDVVWCTTGTGWAEAAGEILCGAWSRGAGIVICTGSFDPEKNLELVERLGVTILAQTPAEYRLMADHPSLVEHDLSNVRRAVSVGEPDADVSNVFLETCGITLHEWRAGGEPTPAVAAEDPIGIPAVDGPAGVSAVEHSGSAGAALVDPVQEPPPAELRVDEVLLREVRDREVAARDTGDEIHTRAEGSGNAESAPSEVEPVEQAQEQEPSALVGQSGEKQSRRAMRSQLRQLMPPPSAPVAADDDPVDEEEERHDWTNQVLLSRLSAYGHHLNTET